MLLQKIDVITKIDTYKNFFNDNFNFFIFLKNLFKVYLVLVFFVLVVIVFGIIFSGDFSWGFCLTNECLNVVGLKYSMLLNLLKEITIFMGTLAAGIGVLVAWKTYDLSLQNSIMANHSANLKNFIDFSKIYISRNPNLDLDKIDLYKFYNVVFPNSRQGHFSKFDNYYDKLEKAKELVEYSNSSYNNANETDLRFPYKNHQKRFIELFIEMGIDVDYRQRRDFEKIEKCIYLFVDSITQNFTAKKISLSEINKDYM